MAKTEKELAFLRDLYVGDDWTRRFTDVVDAHIDLTDSDNMLYVNAGTGGHALALDERFGERTDIFAYCDTDACLAIARDKAAAVRSSVDFSRTRFEDEAFDTVVVDASFVRPADVASVIDEAVRVTRTGGEVAAFLPASGSFGEVFSLLWEILFNDDLGDHGAAAERMISEIPTVSTIERMAADAGLVNVQTKTVNEVFEFENGAQFVAAPLVAEFLLPAWLECLSDNEKGRVTQELAQLIDAEDGTLTFRFSVKATLMTGEKA